ncbi:hypothetical protein Taro_039268 [Colocasia esculenta]|uniref:Uncharacterized protein n=1 Tax=Colocasia esculenta TaxID=4460 RepID=A0A843WG72_COLES|nr:hypothetical protein [Colocasia esculenta]
MNCRMEGGGSRGSEVEVEGGELRPRSDVPGGCGLGLQSGGSAQVEEEKGNPEYPEDDWEAQVERMKRYLEYPRDDRAAQVEEVSEGLKTLEEWEGKDVALAQE